MSAAARAYSSRPEPARLLPGARPVRNSRPHLRAVAAPEQARSLAPFAWTCILIIVSALVGVLLLNTTMAEGAYERRDLKIEIANLHQERSRLIGELEANQSASRLAEAATAMGMEKSKTQGFVSLSEGSVLENTAGNDKDSAPADGPSAEETAAQAANASGSGEGDA